VICAPLAAAAPVTWPRIVEVLSCARAGVAASIPAAKTPLTSAASARRTWGLFAIFILLVVARRRVEAARRW
jgi:hypothetical protein